MNSQSSSKKNHVVRKLVKQTPTNGRIKQTADSQSVPMMASTNGEALEERIRLRAYQLYAERGSQDNHAVEDWLQAEREILAFS